MPSCWQGIAATYSTPKDRSCLQSLGISSRSVLDFGFSHPVLFLSLYFWLMFSMLLPDFPVCFCPSLASQSSWSTVLRETAVFIFVLFGCSSCLKVITNLQCLASILRTCFIEANKWLELFSAETIVSHIKQSARSSCWSKWRNMTVL